MATDRLLAKRHEERPYHSGYFDSWAKDASSSHPFHFRDGLNLWVGRAKPESDPLGLLGGEDDEATDPASDATAHAPERPPASTERSQ